MGRRACFLLVAVHHTVIRHHATRIKVKGELCSPFPRPSFRTDLQRRVKVFLARNCPCFAGGCRKVLEGEVRHCGRGLRWQGGAFFHSCTESCDRAILVENQRNTKQMLSRASGGKSCDGASSCTSMAVWALRMRKSVCCIRLKGNSWWPDHRGVLQGRQ